MEEMENIINTMLKENLHIKYKKNNKEQHRLSYEELINYTIELEIVNNHLQRRLEILKIENTKITQKGIDMETDRLEMQRQMIEAKGKLKLFTCDTCNLNTQGVFNTFNTVSTKGRKTEINRRERQGDSSFLEEISVDQKNASIVEMLKNQKQKMNYFHGENFGSIGKTNYKEEIRREKELNDIVQDNKALKIKLKEKENMILEKDTIINILYQEIENLKYNIHNNIIKNINNPEEEYLKGTTFRTPEPIYEETKFMENLEFIKLSLIDFLKSYHINDNFNFSTREDLSSSELIETKMQEIKFIILNLKKINIIFKSLMNEFAQNVNNMITEKVTKKVDLKLYKLKDQISKLTLHVKGTRGINNI
jgi:hypothetical protein